ncbi:lipid A biosynthesis acyltransferase [Flavobacteriaceae bacterium F08102]|nr:lipid A biosynthesis acyltransferase [Flavobacteriaceae bacterium F08102]
MHFLSFILVYPFIWLISILPFRVMHLVSDFFYIVTYYIIRYRRKVVEKNVRLAFPEKSPKEIKSLIKKSYRHFVDVLFEMIKSFTISEAEISARYKFTNIELIHALEKQGKSILLMGGHYGNWEWIFILNKYIKSTGFAVYKKLENPYFERQIRRSRGRFGTHLVPTKETSSTIDRNHREKVQAMYGFLTDQSPKRNKAHHWGPFFGVEVPIHTGAEYLAKKHDLAVVMFTTKRVKRGYYESTFEILTEQPNSVKDFEITDTFLQKFEDHIKEAPAYYFWTHKRFKHAKFKSTT